MVALILSAAAINDLVSGSAPVHSVQAMIATAVSALVLAPLGWAKHRTGAELHSHALKGDGTLGAMGAVLGCLALLGLLGDQLLGWWWADRAAALAVAAVAVAEAIRVMRMRPDYQSTTAPQGRPVRQ